MLFNTSGMTLNTATLSDAIILPAEKAWGQVKSIHNDYVNILTSKGLLTLVRKGMAHIPFGIEVDIDGGWLNIGLTTNQLVQYNCNEIVIEKTMLVTELEKCPRFSCKPSYSSPRDSVDFSARLQCLQKLCKRVGEVGGIITYLWQYDAEEFCTSKNSAGVIWATIPQRIKILISGVLQNDEFLMIEGICGLLGVGPGSTPSGDDFLLGFLSGMTHVQHNKYQQTSEKMAHHMLENAKKLTTLLSIEYMKYGVKGLYHQSFSEMISEFVSGTEEEMVRKAQVLMTLGHSSGVDLLIGFIYGGFTALTADILADAKGERNEHL